MKRGLLLAALGLCLTTHAADWPRFRGPTGDGVTPDTTIPLTWSQSQNLLWRTELPGPGSSSPIVSGDKVFLTSYSGYGTDIKDPGDPAKLVRHAICLDRRTGKILWQHEVKTENPTKPYTGQYITMHGYASSTPVTDGAGVFFFFANAGVHAFTVDGRKVWEANVGEKTHDWGVGSSPILYKDLVIINAAHESNQLVALERRTGKTVWSVSGFPASWNTPTLVKSAEGREELVLNASGKIRAFDPNTGDELWSCQSIKAAELCPSVIAHEGIIYILGHPAGRSQAVRAGGKGDVTATHILWQTEKGSNVGSPVYHNGHLYFVNDSRGEAICLDAKTGQIVYEQRMSRNRDRWYASPILSGDRIYYVSRTSGAFVLAAKPEFEVLATNTLTNDSSVFNGSPAVADGQIFLRSDKFAYCIGRP